LAVNADSFFRCRLFLDQVTITSSFDRLGHISFHFTARMDIMNGFRQSHAVVIGINGYGNRIPSLRTAVNDARRIAEILETEFGYASNF